MEINLCSSKLDQGWDDIKKFPPAGTAPSPTRITLIPVKIFSNKVTQKVPNNITQSVPFYSFPSF